MVLLHINFEISKPIVFRLRNEKKMKDLLVVRKRKKERNIILSQNMYTLYANFNYSIKIYDLNKLAINHIINVAKYFLLIQFYIQIFHVRIYFYVLRRAIYIFLLNIIQR